ncbi:cuticle protein 1-like [Hyposmocoma kahamanoa]|uniref:cuticle protein 1-like n=1 Tax=Hyposmocoma kahamanoa TaxID=1477025 RepID=UPI000E6D8072|nr:cuticle protein 1-like [Hyposmocoma kahamanoa]
MYAKLFLLLALAAAALAREYPAGVHPAVCPNYPYCDTEALARHSPDGTPIPEWVRNPGILPVAPAAYAAAAPGAVPAAPRYPADFPAALCPNYPYCW